MGLGFSVPFKSTAAASLPLPSSLELVVCDGRRYAFISWIFWATVVHFVPTRLSVLPLLAQVPSKACMLCVEGARTPFHSVPTPCYEFWAQLWRVCLLLCSWTIVFHSFSSLVSDYVRLCPAMSGYVRLCPIMSNFRLSSLQPLSSPLVLTIVISFFFFSVPDFVQLSSVQRTACVTN